MDARETALVCLNICQHQGGWSDAVLKKQLAAARLDAREGALATQLCFGVQQNQLLLDFYLGEFSNMPLKRMESKVVQALRLGAYQLLFLDKIPPSAAVNSSVALVKQVSKNARAAGMVNGILRSLERSRGHLPDIPQTDQTEYLSIKYSHPRWLVEELLAILDSDGVEKLLREHNSQPPVTAMVNTRKTTQEALLQELPEAKPHPWMENCVILGRTGRLEELPAFQEGEFYIQDPAARLAVETAKPAPGMRVLDLCAAPGGKSFAAALAMEDQGEIIACDLHPHKKRLLEAGIKRLGLTSIQAKTQDGREFCPEWEEAFDLVIADVPCSGLGVIRKKPDIRYKDPEPLKGLPAIQLALLENAARYLKRNGILLYSTCTILRRENEDVAAQFLAGHPDFSMEESRTLWPHIDGTDGFFLCKLRKGGSAQ